jgi:hypothetical protein
VDAGAFPVKNESMLKSAKIVTGITNKMVSSTCRSKALMPISVAILRKNMIRERAALSMMTPDAFFKT